MPRKIRPLDRIAALTQDDLEAQAGNRILSRGKDYQRSGRVSDLATTADGGVIAWIGGTHLYATMVNPCRN